MTPVGGIKRFVDVSYKRAELTPRLTTVLPSRLPTAVDSEQWELARRIHLSMLPERFCDERVEELLRKPETYDAGQAS